MSRVGETISTIQDLSDELVHISETDADVNAFVVGRAVVNLTAANFKAANYMPPNAQIEQVAFNDFFGSQASVAWVALSVFMLSQLTSLTVFKTLGVRREIFAVGLMDGCIVGIRTFAIET